MNWREVFSLTKKPYRLRDMAIVVGIFAVMLFGFMYLLSNINVDESNVKYQDRFYFVSDGWDITVDGEPVGGTLPVWVDVEPNGSVTLSRTLPADMEPDYAFATRNYHHELRAYVDGKLIYSFPSEDQVMSGTVMTDDWNMIPVNPSYEGSKIDITFKTSNAGYNGYINPFYFGEDNSILASIKSQNLLPYGLSLTIVILGLLLILVDSVYTKNYVDKSHLLLGFIFLAVGMWFADRSRMPIFVIGSNVKFFLAFSGFIFVPILLSFYAGERFPKHNQAVVNILSIADLVMMGTLFTLVATRGVPVHSIVQYIYLFAGISILYTIFLLWYYSYGKGKRTLGRVALNSVRLEFISAVLTVVFSVLSILVDALTTGNWSSSQRDWTGIGNLQMVAVIIFGFFHLIVLLYQGYYGVLENEETQKQLHNSQLQLMMGQIQPHFMFNTLSSIRTLIKIDPDMAYNMTYNFSNYLRANVDNLTNLDGIGFAAEVKHIESYVGIEEVRFGDRLHVEYDIQESDFIVPPLSIQPLIENAIKHGVCQRPEGGTVWLSSYSEGDNYVIEVKDNGVGIPEEKLNALFPKKPTYAVSEYAAIDEDTWNRPNLTGNGSEEHESTGMKNIILRLREISNATLDVKSEVGKGTIIKVYVPKKID